MCDSDPNGIRENYKEVSIVSVDLAKQVFWLREATVAGGVVLRKKLSRRQFLVFMQGDNRPIFYAARNSTKPPLPWTSF